MGQGSRWEYLRGISERYQDAAGVEESRILNESCEVASNRKYVWRLLNGSPQEGAPFEVAAGEVLGEGGGDPARDLGIGELPLVCAAEGVTVPSGCLGSREAGQEGPLREDEAGNPR